MSENFDKLRIVMPYGSLVINLPLTWVEDNATEEDFLLYYDNSSDSGTFRIRRDDFEYNPEDDFLNGSEFGGVDVDGADHAMFSGFARLLSTLRAPGVENIRIEPRYENTQLITYQKTGQQNGIDLLVQWWIYGALNDQTFTVASFSYAMPIAMANTPAYEKQVKVLDGQVRNAVIHPLDKAVEYAKESNTLFAFNAAKRQKSSEPVEQPLSDMDFMPIGDINDSV